MKILVQDHYGFKKIYEGSPMDVEHGILRDFPWLDYLKSYNRAHAQRLRTMLQVLGRAQIYEVKVLDNLMADGIEYDNSLYKALHHEDFSSFSDYLPRTVRDTGVDYNKEHVDTTKETTPHTTLHDAYKKHVIDSPNRVQPDFDSKKMSGITSKMVFGDVPSHLSGGSRFIVKPYTSNTAWHGHSEGWQEMTSQALYHAGGIGDLHQKVHVANHPVPINSKPTEVPAIVIHMEPDYETAYNRSTRYDAKPADHESNKEAAKKMFLMDYLSNQSDRHEGNLMLHKETGKPMAIDNAQSFYYGGPPRSSVLGGPPDWYKHFISFYHGDVHGSNALEALAPFEGRPGSGDDYNDFFRGALDWWKEQSPKIQGEFANRLSLIQDPVHKEKVRKGFNDRAAMLDKWAKEGLKPDAS